MINQYRVFQIKEVHHQHWAKSYAQQVEDGFLIHHQNYQSAYKGKPAPSDTPMTARKRLEEKRPNTFIGRSFGVGDVIVWDEEKGRKFFYVDKEELVEFGGFMDADAAGNTVIYMVPNYQIDGKTGTWLPYDSEVVEGVCFFMMRNEQRKDAVSPVVVDSKGVFVTDAPNGFENVRSILTEYGQQNSRKEDIMKAIRWLLKSVLVIMTLPLILTVWLIKWFVVFLHHCSAWTFYLRGSVVLATAVLSFLMQQSQGIEALQMLIGGFVIFMIPQVVGSVVVLLELVAVMLRQVWYI